MEQLPGKQDPNPGSDHERRRNDFLTACERQLEELKREGIFPLHYIEARLAAAQLIRGGFENPDVEGYAFANAGAEERKRFLGMTDVLVGMFRKKMGPYIIRINAFEKDKVAQLISSEGRWPDLASVRESIEEPWRCLQKSLDEWRETQLLLGTASRDPRVMKLLELRLGSSELNERASKVAGTSEFRNVLDATEKDQITGLVRFTFEQIAAGVEDLLARMDQAISSKDSGVVLHPEAVTLIRKKGRDLRNLLDTFQGNAKDVIQKADQLADTLNDPGWDAVIGEYEKAVSDIPEKQSGDTETTEEEPKLRLIVNNE